MNVRRAQETVVRYPHPVVLHFSRTSVAAGPQPTVIHFRLACSGCPGIADHPSPLTFRRLRDAGCHGRGSSLASLLSCNIGSFAARIPAVCREHVHLCSEQHPQKTSNASAGSTSTVLKATGKCADRSVAVSRCPSFGTRQYIAGQRFYAISGAHKFLPVFSCGQCQTRRPGYIWPRRRGWMRAAADGYRVRAEMPSPGAREKLVIRTLSYFGVRAAYANCRTLRLRNRETGADSFASLGQVPSVHG